jgi:hypothetical protein
VNPVALADTPVARFVAGVRKMAEIIRPGFGAELGPFAVELLKYDADIATQEHGFVAVLAVWSATNVLDLRTAVTNAEIVPKTGRGHDFGWQAMENVLQRYQRCAQAIWSLFGDVDPLAGDDLTQGLLERLEALVARQLIAPVTKGSVVRDGVMHCRSCGTALGLGDEPEELLNPDEGVKFNPEEGVKT